MLERPGDGHPLWARAQADLRNVVRHIEQITGVRSRWNGSLQVRGLEFGNSGQKHRSCEISVREDVLQYPEFRWSTMIHEGLHSVSGGFAETGVTPDIWEEAIVEQTQRIIRPMILSALGIEIPEDALAARDLSHPYNRDIRQLELVRLALHQNAFDFYLGLLTASITERTKIRIEAQRLRRQGRETEI
jgi:hypothetical protein